MARALRPGTSIAWRQWPFFSLTTNTSIARPQRPFRSLPGIRDLGKGNAQLGSVSCASAGNCAAGDFYGSVQGETFYKGFVVSEKNGVWGRAIEVPGLGTLTTGRFARVVSVSCASPGNCAAGGDYEGRNLHNQGFVVSEKNGVWGRAIKVPGLAALNNGGNAGVGSVSCLAGHLRSRQVLRGPLRPQQPPPGFRHLGRHGHARRVPAVGWALMAITFARGPGPHSSPAGRTVPPYRPQAPLPEQERSS